MIRGNIRKQDLVIRWGGEEFLLFLSRAPIDLALRVCERIRLAIASLVLDWQGERLKVTASFGLCAVPPLRPFKFLLEEADRALYEAKRKGKNRIELCAL